MSSRLVISILALLLVIPSVFAISRTCTRELDTPRIDQSMILCADNYYPHNYPQGLNITKDNIILDCGSSVLHGQFKNAGIVVINRKNVTIKNCQIANYGIGMLVKQSKQIKVINTNFIHNQIGLKVADSSAIVVENSYDISTQKPLQVVNSTGNVFHYLNKNMEGDYCRLNQCNTPTGFAVKEQITTKATVSQNTIGRNLRNNLRQWLYPSKSVFS